MNTMKYFTPQEATETLPLVKRIVSDILKAREPDELEDLFSELESLGCYYKDWNFEIGLVDFPARMEGQDVFLCWRSDEPEIQWYHRMEEGFAGRKRIPQSLFKGGMK